MHRHGCASVHQFEILPRPPEARPDANPWPTWPLIYRTASAHEEGGDRVFAVNTECFLGDDAGNVRALRAHEVEQKFVDGRMVFEKIEGSDFELPCDLALLAMGFVGPERDGLLEQLGVELTDRGNVARDERWATNVDGVFVCGDMGRGQSLIVWAIAEGPFVRGGGRRGGSWATTDLPAPITPDAAPMAVALTERGRARCFRRVPIEPPPSPLGAAATRGGRRARDLRRRCRPRARARCSRRTAPASSRCGSASTGPSPGGRPIRVG